MLGLEVKALTFQEANLIFHVDHGYFMNFYYFILSSILESEVDNTQIRLKKALFYIE